MCDASIVTSSEVSGTVHSVTLHPSGGGVVREDISDETGIVHLVWLGRRRLTGIVPSRQISARGRLRCVTVAKVIFNPEYESPSRASGEPGASPSGRRCWSAPSVVGGMFDSGLPAVVFVAVYLLNGRVLQPALIAALGAGVVILVWRLIRRQPLTQVLAGFAGGDLGVREFPEPAKRATSSCGSDRERRLRIGVPDLAGCSVAPHGRRGGGVTGDPTGWRRDPELATHLRRSDLGVGAGVRWPDPGTGSAVPRRLVGALGTAKIIMGWPLFCSAPT